MSSSPKTWIGATIGSTTLGMIPTLWGADMFSFSSIIFSAIGALVGVYVAFKLAQY